MLRTYRADRQVEITSLVDASASMAIARARRQARPRARDRRVARVHRDGRQRRGANRRVRDAPRRRCGSKRRRSIAAASRISTSSPFVTSVRTGRRDPPRRRGRSNCCMQRRPAGMVDRDFGFSGQRGRLRRRARRGCSRRATRSRSSTSWASGESPAPIRRGCIACATPRPAKSARRLRPEAAAACRRRKVEQIAASVREFCTARAITYAQAFGARQPRDLHGARTARARGGALAVGFLSPHQPAYGLSLAAAGADLSALALAPDDRSVEPDAVRRGRPRRWRSVRHAADRPAVLARELAALARADARDRGTCT